jgi:hypothetical protein
MKMMPNVIAIAALAAATTSLMPLQASAERVCRQECIGPVCTEKCVEETTDRDRTQGQGQRQGQEEKREQEKRDQPVIQVVPGVQIR